LLTDFLALSFLLNVFRSLFLSFFFFFSLFLFFVLSSFHSSFLSSLFLHFLSSLLPVFDPCFISSFFHFPPASSLSACFSAISFFRPFSSFCLLARLLGTCLSTCFFPTETFFP